MRPRWPSLTKDFWLERSRLASGLRFLAREATVAKWLNTFDNITTNHLSLDFLFPIVAIAKKQQKLSFFSGYCGFPRAPPPEPSTSLNDSGCK